MTRTTTKVNWVHREKNKHLRSYVPDFIANALKLTNGDRIEWNIEASNGNIRATIIKATDKDDIQGKA